MPRAAQKAPAKKHLMVGQGLLTSLLLSMEAPLRSMMELRSTISAMVVGRSAVELMAMILSRPRADFGLYGTTYFRATLQGASTTVLSLIDDRERRHTGTPQICSWTIEMRTSEQFGAITHPNKWLT